MTTSLLTRKGPSCSRRTARMAHSSLEHSTFRSFSALGGGSSGAFTAALVSSSTCTAALFSSSTCTAALLSSSTSSAAPLSPSADPTAAFTALALCTALSVGPGLGPGLGLGPGPGPRSWCPLCCSKSVAALAAAVLLTSLT